MACPRRRLRGRGVFACSWDRKFGFLSSALLSVSYMTMLENREGLLEKAMAAMS